MGFGGHWGGSSWGGCWVDSQVSTVVRGVLWMGVHVSRDVVVSEEWAVLLVLFAVVVSLGFAMDFVLPRVKLSRFVAPYTTWV